MNSGERESDDVVRNNFIAFVKEPTDSGSGGGEVGVPVCVSESEPALTKSFLDWFWGVNVTLNLAVRNVDVLETDGGLRFV